MSDQGKKLLRFLRVTYQEVLQGFSYEPEYEIYFKHFNEEDLSTIDFALEAYTERIIEQGIPSEEEKIIDLIDQEQWPLEKEAAFSSLGEQIKNAKVLIAESHDRTLIESQKKLIEERTEALNKIVEERAALTGKTREDYITKKQSDLTIFHTFYKDSKFKEKEFSEDEFEYLDQKELNEFVLIFNKISEKFSSKNMRRIAAMPFFLNRFFLSDGNPQVFFGKPVVDLTTFQVDIYAQGKMYKNILETTEKGETPPEEWYEDPDKLVEWYYFRTKGGNKSVENASAGSSAFHSGDDNFVGGKSMVGASIKDQMARRKPGESTVDLNKELEKVKSKKGKWTMWDLLRIHGENVDQAEQDMQEYHAETHDAVQAEERLTKEQESK